VVRVDRGDAPQSAQAAEEVWLHGGKSPQLIFSLPIETRKYPDSPVHPDQDNKERHYLKGATSTTPGPLGQIPNRLSSAACQLFASGTLYKRGRCGELPFITLGPLVDWPNISVSALPNTDTVARCPLQFLE
jgi:hypothetical protein